MSKQDEFENAVKANRPLAEIKQLLSEATMELRRAMAAFQAAAETALEQDVECMKAVRPLLLDLEESNPGIVAWWDEKIAQRERPS